MNFALNYLLVAFCRELSYDSRQNSPDAAIGETGLSQIAAVHLSIYDCFFCSTL